MRMFTCVLALAFVPSVHSVLATCPDTGSGSALEFSFAYATYALESAAFGAWVGAESDGCILPVTPKARTFSIWGYINAHQAVLAPTLSSNEAYHLTQALQASSRWYRSFAGSERDNLSAQASVREMECHARKAATHACEVEPNAVACCAHTQALGLLG